MALLHQQVYERLLDQITTGELPVGERLPPEHELVEIHGVSAITMKRALGRLRDEGYIVRRPRLGTVVVSAVPTSSSSGSRPRLGCIVTDFDDSFGSRVIGGLLDGGRTHNVDVVLARTLSHPENEDDAIRSLVASGVQGIILEPTSSAYASPAMLDLVAKGFPLVVVDRAFDGVPVSSVCSDNVTAARHATDYLIGLGHTRIGLVTSASPVSTIEERREGFLYAHASAQIPHDEHDELHTLTSTTPGTDSAPAEDLERLREFVREHDDLTAFLATEYNIAVLLRAALAAEGRSVPGDASIVAFDQPHFFYVEPGRSFTHVRQQQGVMGAEAVRLAMEQVGSHGPVRKVALDTELVAGDSTGAPAVR